MKPAQQDITVRGIPQKHTRAQCMEHSTVHNTEPNTAQKLAQNMVPSMAHIPAVVQSIQSVMGCIPMDAILRTVHLVQDVPEQQQRTAIGQMAHAAVMVRVQILAHVVVMVHVAILVHAAVMVLVQTLVPVVVMVHANTAAQQPVQSRHKHVKKHVHRSQIAKHAAGQNRVPVRAAFQMAHVHTAVQPVHIPIHVPAIIPLVVVNRRVRHVRDVIHGHAPVLAPVLVEQSASHAVQVFIWTQIRALLIHILLRITQMAVQERPLELHMNTIKNQTCGQMDLRVQTMHSLAGQHRQREMQCILTKQKY